MKYFGMYRGICKHNDDSETEYPYRGRIKVWVPEVYGDELKIPDELPWAEPCMSIFGGGRADKYSHGTIAVPPAESAVWVMFEKGDSQKPVYLGTWYGHKDLGDEGYEMPLEARYDNRTGISYPNICVLKIPWKPIPLNPNRDIPEEGMYVRFVRGQRIEVVFHENQNYIELDGVSKKILVNVEGWDIELNASKLNVGAEEDEEPTYIGGNINIQAEGNVTIGCAALDINADNDVSIDAQNNLHLFGKEDVRVSSDDIIIGNAPAATGFDQHP